MDDVNKFKHQVLIPLIYALLEMARYIGNYAKFFQQGAPIIDITCNQGFKFSTDPQNLEEEKLKKLASHYPDNLSRAIIAYAAWCAINKSNDVSLEKILEIVMSAPRKQAAEEARLMKREQARRSGKLLADKQASTFG